MSLTLLNNDVLLAIFATLHGKDALNVSLTSKRAYTFAGPRIASRIDCKFSNPLRQFHAYLMAVLPDGTPRGRFLEWLRIDESVLILSAHPDRYVSNSLQAAHLIGDILLQARNLRKLRFECFQLCIERDPRIMDAIRSLTGLVKLKLFSVADSSLHVFDSFASSRLARLTLSYYRWGDLPLQNENITKTLSPLISALSSFRQLHSVTLCGLYQQQVMLQPQRLLRPWHFQRYRIWRSSRLPLTSWMWSSIALTYPRWLSSSLRELSSELAKVRNGPRSVGSG
ncbi:hypothetical protein C8T65DRAFT_643247 [Cerioporus squamosus]|nr:hypothetical protein C8T65DRAFT_643247 [Cerioporus squamosus]